MALTRQGWDSRGDAIAAARAFQLRDKDGYVYGVEFDALKEPAPHRVMRYDPGVEPVPRRHARINADRVVVFVAVRSSRVVLLPVPDFAYDFEMPREWAA